MAKFETVPVAQLKTRIPGKLLPLVEEYKSHLEKLREDQGGRLVLEKGDDAKDLRRVLKMVAVTLNRQIRFPFRGEEGSLSFYLVTGRGRGRPPKVQEVPAPAPGAKRRGRPRKSSA